MPLPNFLVVGAARAGTTALHYYLGQHPEVCMSRTKEPNHFIFEPAGARPRPCIDPAERRILVKSTSRRDRYERLFRPRPGEHTVGEASPLYLYVPQAPRLIEEGLGRPRLVAVLRHPVDRAWSHFLSLDRGPAGSVASRFEAAVRRELAAPADRPYHSGEHLLRLGFYHDQVRRYRDRFGPEQLKVVLYDDLAADPAATLSELCAFLGVDPSFAFDTSLVYNRSGVDRSGLAGALRRAAARPQPYLKAVLPSPVTQVLGARRAVMKSGVVKAAPPLDPDVRAELVERCRADVEALAGLLGRDLSAWTR